MRQIRERRPDALVIVVTGYGTVHSAVQAMKNGAYDYMTKPFSMEELKLLLDRVAAHLKLKTENRTPAREDQIQARFRRNRRARARRWKSSTASSPKRRRAVIPY